jgi:hypothetical protein
MGGQGFTRVYCKDCMIAAIAEEYYEHQKSGVKLKSAYALDNFSFYR